MIQDEINDRLYQEFVKADELVKLNFDGERIWLLAKFEEFSSDELELIRCNEFNWKIVRIAQTSFLCFSPAGYSWNEVSLHLADQSQNLTPLVQNPIKTIPIRFVAVSQATGEILTDRDFELDETKTKSLISAVKSQKTVTPKNLSDTALLGDPTPLLKAMQKNELPDILGVKVNEREGTVMIETDMLPERDPKEPRAKWQLRHFENLYRDKLPIFNYFLEEMANDGSERVWSNCLLPTYMFEYAEGQFNRAELGNQLAALGQTHLIDELLPKISPGNFTLIYTAALFNWRYSKGIYDFDDELRKSIYLASLPTHIDAGIFSRLPEYCVYVKTPDLHDWNGKPIQGFFAMTEAYPSEEEEIEEDEAWLYILLDIAETDLDKGHLNILKIPIDFGTIGDSLIFLETVEPKKERDLAPVAEELKEWISPLLNQLLYLCSEQPEIDHLLNKDKIPGTLDVKKVKKGHRLFPSETTNDWLCGWRTGNFIREQKRREQENSIDETTKTVKSHLRRAHWHTFYAGKRNQPDREVRIKWLHLIKVNFDEYDTTKLPAVIKRVKKE